MKTYKNTIKGASILFNPGKNTVFNYRLTKNINEEKCDEINKKRIFSEKVAAIKEAGAELVFSGIRPSKRNSNRFTNNLVLMDCCMPELVGIMLLYQYEYNLRYVSEITAKLEENNPLGLDLSDNHNYYKAKIKRLLLDCALGMTAGKVWDGNYEANGGYLIVGETGDIICYHLYEKKFFEDYLFHNTRLETPDPKRYEFGSIETSEDGKQYFSLNLQIRFAHPQE